MRKKYHHTLKYITSFYSALLSSTSISRIAFEVIDRFAISSLIYMYVLTFFSFYVYNSNAQGARACVQVSIIEENVYKSTITPCRIIAWWFYFHIFRRQFISFFPSFDFNLSQFWKKSLLVLKFFFTKIVLLNYILFFCIFQPTWRLWGEEKGDGVIYTVYLKKVRYHRPTKSLSASVSIWDTN